LAEINKVNTEKNCSGFEAFTNANEKNFVMNSKKAVKTLWHEFGQYLYAGNQF